MLSDHQVDLIRHSAKRLAVANVAATNAFYSNLFAHAPGVRPLFPDDMFGQSEKLWQSIVMVVESADNLNEIEKALRDLGAKHVRYGADAAHYDVVTDVLLETISAVMADEWSDDHYIAWKEALDAVCAVMLNGAEAHAR